MVKKPNIYGGGAQTNANGLLFEQTTNLNDALRNAGYDVHGVNVFKNGKLIGYSLSKHNFYQHYLVPNGIDYKTINSKKWLPDDAFLNIDNSTLYIIEKKFQNVAGSVDEKLPNCHFKKQEYQKLVSSLGITVEYIYVFSDWFKKEQYRDVLDYIEQIGCYYYYNKLPLESIGLY